MLYYLAAYFGVNILAGIILTLSSDDGAKRVGYFASLVLSSIAAYGVYRLL